MQAFRIPLFSQRDRRPVPKAHGKIIGHDIDDHSSDHDNNREPNAPVTVRVFPVRLMKSLHGVVLRPSMSMVMLITVIHLLTSLSEE